MIQKSVDAYILEFHKVMFSLTVNEFFKLILLDVECVFFLLVLDIHVHQC